MLRTVLCAAALALTPLASTAQDDKVPIEGKVIKIVINLPLTGEAGPTGNAIANAFDLAVREASASGLPGGYRVETVRYDYGGIGEKNFDQERAAQNLRVEIADPDVLIAYGPEQSEVARDEIPLLNRVHMATIALSPTDPLLTQGPQAHALRPSFPDETNFFRLSGTIDTTAIATGAAHGPAPSQASLRAGQRDPDQARARAPVRRGVHRPRERSSAGTRRSRISTTTPTFIARIRAVHPDAIYFPALGVELGAFRNQLGRAGLDAIPVYSDGAATSDGGFAANAGVFTTNTYLVSTYPDPDGLDNRIAKRFARTFAKTYGTKPIPWEVGAYTAGEIAMTAIRAALSEDASHPPTRAALRKLIAHTTDLSTALGSVTFDQNGDLVHPYVAYYRFDAAGKLQLIRQFRVTLEEIP